LEFPDGEGKGGLNQKTFCGGRGVWIFGIIHWTNLVLAMSTGIEASVVAKPLIILAPK